MYSTSAFSPQPGRLASMSLLAGPPPHPPPDTFRPIPFSWVLLTHSAAPRFPLICSAQLQPGKGPRFRTVLLPFLPLVPRETVSGPKPPPYQDLVTIYFSPTSSSFPFPAPSSSPPPPPHLKNSSPYFPSSPSWRKSGILGEKKKKQSV